MKLKIGLILILIGSIKCYGNSLPPTFDGPYQGENITNNENSK